jgi:hypothetical protein
VNKKPKINYKLLTYDIETGLLKASIFRLGEQTIRHEQLDPAFNITPIISIAYKWYHEDKVYVLSGDNAVEEFDKIARQADVCLGKNNTRFDVKHVNTQRMLQGLKAYPEWLQASEDLESQLRKYFAFPSHSLDYISDLLGYGGKVKMEFRHWKEISNYQFWLKVIKVIKLKKLWEPLAQVIFKQSAKKIVQKGKKALKDMLFYNKKDVLDTENVLVRVLPYITLRHNASTKNAGQGCITCGSLRLSPTKIVELGKVRYQQFECLDHNGYAGKSTIRYDKNRNKVYGKMG